MRNFDETPRATVVSILPMKIYEAKPGVICPSLPARIPKARYEDKEIVAYHVCNGIRYQYVPGFPENDPRETVVHIVPAFEIATAICDDYISAKMAFTRALDEDDLAAIPGLMPLDGFFKVEEIKIKFKDQIEKLFAQQDKWFTILLRLADDDWQRFRTHKTITDEQRLAAKCLKIERDWSIDASKSGFIKCQFCRQSIDIEAIICGFCREVVKPEVYKKLHTPKIEKSA
jgi:hypothetical protein